MIVRIRNRTSTGFPSLPAAGQKALLKIALFCAFCGVVGGISAVSPEIRIISWKFKKSAEFSDFLQIFYFSS